MNVRDRIKNFRKSRKKYIITAVLFAALFGLLVYGRSIGLSRAKLIYSQSLDLAAAEVNGSRLTLRDAAIYVALEEAQVEREAYEYNPEAPKEYWNTHVNGIYIRVAARNAAIQMAIHDELFYQLAREEGIELSGSEEEHLAQAARDFWSDLTADGKAGRLGVSEEDVCAAMRKMAYAQKYQDIYAAMEGASYEDYQFGEARYEELLKTQKYRIYKDVWGRVDFGNVTILRDDE